MAKLTIVQLQQANACQWWQRWFMREFGASDNVTIKAMKERHNRKSSHGVPLGWMAGKLLKPKFRAAYLRAEKKIWKDYDRVVEAVWREFPTSEAKRRLPINKARDVRYAAEAEAFARIYNEQAKAIAARKKR